MARAAMATGAEVVQLQQQDRPVPAGLRWRRAMWDRLVLRKIRVALGLDRCQFAASAAAPLPVDVARVFAALGLPLLEVWGMTDRRLFDALERSPSPLARGLAERLFQRQLHVSALVLKPSGYGYVERCSDKPMTVVEWPLAQLRRFAGVVADNARLRQIEDEVGAELGLAPGEALFAAMPYFRKLLPQDVRIHSRSSGGGFGLFEKDRDHLRSLEGDYLRTFAVRLAVPREHRERVMARGEWLSARLESCL